MAQSLYFHCLFEIRYILRESNRYVTNNSCFCLDSYIGMDQQLDLKLDVKEAPAIPQYSGEISSNLSLSPFTKAKLHFLEHWNISESEEEHHEEKDNESEFTTDSEMSDADEK